VNTRGSKTEFSDQLEKWLKGKQPKTIASLEAVFRDKSFAIIFLLLMILPATPLPTGGITHVFEIIVLLLCLELIIGMKAPWLPKKWKHMKLGKTMTGKVIPVMMRRIRWFEERSSARGKAVFSLPLIDRVTGLLVFLLTLGALLSPPFSGLDTLPSLGVVIISLALILEDVVLLIVGTIVGAAGVTLTITLGAALVESSKHFF
jgi:hypothetical protein